MVSRETDVTDAQKDSREITARNALSVTRERIVMRARRVTMATNVVSMVDCMVQVQQSIISLVCGLSRNKSESL